MARSAHSWWPGRCRRCYALRLRLRLVMPTQVEAKDYVERGWRWWRRVASSLAPEWRSRRQAQVPPRCSTLARVSASGCSVWHSHQAGGHVRRARPLARTAARLATVASRKDLVGRGQPHDRDEAVRSGGIMAEAWCERNDAFPGGVTLRTLKGIGPNADLPSVGLDQTLSGFRAMLRNHAGCVADPPAVPVTIQLVADSPSGKRPSRTWRRSPERAPTVVTKSKGRPSTRMAVPFLRYWRTIQPAPRRIPTRMKRGTPVPRVPFGVTRMLTAGAYPKGRAAMRVPAQRRAARATGQ